MIKVTDFGIVKSSRNKKQKKSVRVQLDCFNPDERATIMKLSTEKKIAYTGEKLTTLEAGMPMLKKKRKREEDLIENYENSKEKRSVRKRKEEDLPDTVNTPANVCIAKSSGEFVIENVNVKNNFQNFKIAPLTVAANNIGLNGGKVKKLASIFGNVKIKEVKNIQKGASQAEDHGLANRLANEREPSMETEKKRTWELGQKGAVLPPNVIGADFVLQSKWANRTTCSIVEQDQG